MRWRQRKTVQPSRSAAPGYSTGDSGAGRHRLRDRNTVPVFENGHEWPKWATERTRLLPTIDTQIVRPYVFNSDADRRREWWLR